MRRSGRPVPRPGARAALGHARRWFLRLPAGARRAAGFAAGGLAVAAAMVAGLPLFDVTVSAAALVAVAAFTRGSPGAAATLTVTACWLAAVFPLGWLYPLPRYQAVLLTLLALPVAALAHRVRGYVPWRTVLPALAVAALLAVVTASRWPQLHVLPCWAGAFAVLGYRWFQARRTFAPEAYDSGWAQESEEPERGARTGRRNAGAGGGPGGTGDGPGGGPEDGTDRLDGDGDDGPPAGHGVPRFPPAFGAGTGGERAGPPIPAQRAAAYGHAPARIGRPVRGGRHGQRVPPAWTATEPEITVEGSLAELEAMIGLEPVKEQIRSIAASLEAARLREQAGMPADTPLRHFVFTGPPGTGKTTVARVLAKIFYAFGLLPTAQVVEAQRADLVGEYLGATAPRTNQLVDGALGGVLLIDEAYSLVNAAEGQPDRFGNEAVQTLLKRAEDDRAELVIVLAGYGPQMEEFLSSNPGLSSRFGTRVRFPGYRPAELVRMAEHLADRRGDRFAAAALPVLRRSFEDLARRGVVDELGNGRFVRSLTEAAARARDVRVVGAGPDPTPEDLVTVHAADVERAFAETTERYRGDAETPTLEEALAALDRLVGLEPVKQQVHSIAAQLRVARLRQEQGLPVQPPMRHFVFAGPPGTGKTTVARVLGRVFAALGLLTRPDVIEAQRADLVGEHLGSTALKTNRLVDAALGGVLFVDEAYALHNAGYAGGDAFGAEAVQTLLKRAEDDRDRLVVVLAGYPADMDRLLASNPGLASRFALRVAFPSYGPDELLRLAELLAEQAGDSWEPAALDDLAGLFQRICGRGLIDELGNGRFVRTLYEKACASRDVRVAELGAEVTATELTTVTRADVHAACRDLIPPALRRP